MKNRIKTIKKWLRDKLNQPTEPHVDEIFATIFKDKARYLAVGGKVICKKGIGSITGNHKNWIKIGLGIKDVVHEEKMDMLQQYYAKYTTPNGVVVKLPLSFNDYSYINPLNDKNVHRIYVSKRKFAGLIPEEKKALEYMKIFNSKPAGKSIYKKLIENNYIIVKQ